MVEHASHLETVTRLIDSAWARARVAEALYDVVVRGMEFGPCDLPRQSDRDWLRGAMAMPLQDATDAALQSLAWEMSLALAHAPEDLLERLDHSRRWQELGWE